MPTSCEDLWLIGHTLNWLYNVKGSSMVESVYCDFSKLPDDTGKGYSLKDVLKHYLKHRFICIWMGTGFQRWIGYADVKSAPIYFCLTRDTIFSSLNTPIPFEWARLNEGNALDLTTGIFTSPRTGNNSFSFTGHIAYPASLTPTYFQMGLYFNGHFVAVGRADMANVPDQYMLVQPMSFQVTFHMKAGDQVWLMIEAISPGAYLKDDSHHYTHFTGWLLEEEIFTVNRSVE